MEAGNRCFDMRVPEEINRKIVDHIADVNLTYSDIAREYLLREGLQPEQIIKTGSPMLEVIEAHQSSINASNVLQTLKLNPQGYFLVSAHREETVDNSTRLSTLIGALNQLIQIHQLPIIFSTHPRTRAMLKHLEITPNPLIMFQKPFGFFDYMNLQINAKCVLSDSGTLTEESSIEIMNESKILEYKKSKEKFLLLIRKDDTINTDKALKAENKKELKIVQI